jgi:hypothetical protein
LELAMKKLRCSSLDALWACAPSVLDDDGARIDSSGEASELGQAAHACAASMIRTGKADVDGEAARRGIEDAGELHMMMGFTIRAWLELKAREGFTDPKVEWPYKVAIPGTDFELDGTIDVASARSGTDLIFADWKTGWKDAGYHQQMNGYSYLLWNKVGRPADVRIRAVTVFLRNRVYRVSDHTADTLAAWENDLTRNVLARSDVYRPEEGRCPHCPIFHRCAAQQNRTAALVKAFAYPTTLAENDPMRAMLERATAVLSQITPDNKSAPEVAELLTRVVYAGKLVTKGVDELDKLVRSTVERVGPIPLANGNELALVEQKTRVLDALKAGPVANKHLSTAEQAKCVKVSLPMMLAQYAGKFMRGEKKGARERLETELEAAGAISVVQRKRLMEREPGQEESDEESQ